MTTYAFESLLSGAIDSLVPGAFAGFVATLLCRATKSHETRVNKSDMASILYGELSGIVRDYGNRNAKSGTKSPTRICEGLLSSGNTEFFSQDTRQDPYSLYAELDQSLLKVDGIRVAKATERLESIMEFHHKRRRLFTPTPR